MRATGSKMAALGGGQKVRVESCLVTGHMSKITAESHLMTGQGKWGSHSCLAIRQEEQGGDSCLVIGDGEWSRDSHLVTGQGCCGDLGVLVQAITKQGAQCCNGERGSSLLPSPCHWHLTAHAARTSSQPHSQRHACHPISLL